MTTQDFVTGYDPTGAANISSAQMLQMINAATPADGRGIVTTTVDDNNGNPDVPDGLASIRYQCYIWRRVGATATTYYGWTPTAADNVSGPGMLKWVPITISAIPDNAISNSKLQDNAVTSDKVYSLAWSKITGVPSFILGTDTYGVGNDLAGSTFAAPTIAANAVTDSKLASDAADNSKRAVGVNHIKTGTAYYNLRTNAGGTAVEWYLDHFSYLISNTGIGTAYQVPRVKSDASGLEWTTPYILQASRVDVTATSSLANQLALSGSPDNSSSAGHGNYVAAFDVTITPKLTASKLRITLNLSVGVSAAGTFSAWVMDGATLIGIKPVYCAASTIPVELVASFIDSRAIAGARTYKLYVGSVGATSYINRDGTNANYYGGTLVTSSITVEELTQ